MLRIILSFSVISMLILLQCYISVSAQESEFPTPLNITEFHPVTFSNPAFRLPTNSVTFEEVKKRPQRGRVIGGKEALSGEIPYQVGILMKEMGIWCGGSILSAGTVITAAHCFYSNGNLVDKKDYVFTAGKTDLSQVESKEQLSGAASVIIHPKYSPKTGSFDIAIVKLSMPFCFNSRIQPIPLIGPNITPSGKAWVSGWGYTLVRKFGEKIEESSEKFSKILKMTSLVLLSKEECVAKYSNVSSKLYRGLSKHESVICAQAKRGSDDACQGDSGGPLTCLSETGDKVLCGVISCGRGCGLPNFPAFYTHLSYLHKWIQDTAGSPGIPCTE